MSEESPGLAASPGLLLRRLASRPGPRRALLVLLVLLTAARVISLAHSFFAPGWERWSFYDFRLWRGGLEQYQRTGILYDTAQPGYFLPGSRSLYKYPPTFAALMKPFTGVSQHVTARVFLFGNLLCLAAFLAGLLSWIRPPAWKAWVLALLLLNWQPIWEVLSDLQMELILLGLIGLSVAAWKRGREVLSGAALGVAGAFKVYPWLLLAECAGRRQWRALLGGVAGAVCALGAVSPVLPFRLTLEFFARILPHIGGTSLSYDNVSLLASLGRLSLLARGQLPGAEALDAMTLETLPSSGVRLVSRALFAVLAGGMLYRSVRPFLRARSRPEALGLLVSLMLLLIPTSWLSYQALLAFPALACAGATPMNRENRASWILLGTALLCGIALNSYDAPYEKIPGIYSLARTLLAVSLWAAQLARLRSGPKSVIMVGSS